MAQFFHRKHSTQAHVRLPEETTNVSQTQIRIALVGASGCGKTSLLKRFDKNIFESSTPKTIGATTATKQGIKYSEINPAIAVSITDISHESYETSNEISRYFKLRYDIIYFCYDRSSINSFNKLQIFAKDAEVKSIIANKKIILVGCKGDLDKDSEITRDNIELLKKEIDCSEEYDCSAKTDTHTDTQDTINNIFIISIQHYFENNFSLEEQPEEEQTSRLGCCCTIL